jgi:hypothetical protein
LGRLFWVLAFLLELVGLGLLLELLVGIFLFGLLAEDENGLAVDLNHRILSLYIFLIDFDIVKQSKLLPTIFDFQMIRYNLIIR